MLNGKFVLVACSNREYNGSIYFNATIEMDNKVMQINVDKVAFQALENNKYKEFIGDFELGVSKNGLFCRLKDARLASSK